MVNGKPAQKQELADGDVVSIDDHEFVYNDLRENTEDTVEEEDSRAG